MPEPTPQDDLLGVLLGGAYAVRGRIGAGGMGSVYRADHVRLPKAFAIKVLNEAVDPTSEPYLRFRREAEVCSRLKHEHIVEVVDFNLTEDGRPFIVMELLEGEDLGSRLERVGRFSLADTIRILGQVSSALSEAHDQGVVHRDMKPQNIFLCHRRNREDVVKLVDFGISKIQGGDSMLTGVHVAMGTPFYMSPEQTGAGDGQVDHRTDVYALGVIAYQMLTGKLPYVGENFAQLVASILTKPPVSVSAHLSGFSPAVDAVIQRAMAKEPSARFQTVAAFDEALRSAALGVTGLGALATFPLAQAAPGASLPGQGGSAFLPAGVEQATPPNTLLSAAGERSQYSLPVKRKGGSRLWLLILGLVAAAACAVVIILVFARGDRGEGSSSRPAASAGQSASAMEAPSEAPDHPRTVKLVASRVVLRLLGLPEGARCRVDGRLQEGNPIVLNRSDQPVLLLCEAPGRQAFARSLAPEEDSEVRVSMPVDPAQADSAGTPETPQAALDQPRPMAVSRPVMRYPMTTVQPMRPSYDDIPVE